MWYVIPTIAGKEESLCEWINAYLDARTYTKCFVPMREDVLRKDGIGTINLKKMFEGYLFLDTDHPDEVLEQIDKTSKFSALVAKNSDGSRELLPIHKGEERFFDQVLVDGVLKVSYVKRNKNYEIIQIIGPLEKYKDRIDKMDAHHRRAFVKIPLLREEKVIKFGLWTDEDPKIEWIEAEKIIRGVIR